MGSCNSTIVNDGRPEQVHGLLDPAVGYQVGEIDSEDLINSRWAKFLDELPPAPKDLLKTIFGRNDKR